MSDPVLPGASPCRRPGGPAGALVLHGFTGSPHSMRPLAERLGRRRLHRRAAPPARPRHQRRRHAADQLGRLVGRGRAGLSSTWPAGPSRSSWPGCRWAAPSPAGWPPATPRSPGWSASTRRSSRRPRRSSSCCRDAPTPVPRPCPGIGSDIAQPGVTELAYEAHPDRAAAVAADGRHRARAPSGRHPLSRCSCSPARRTTSWRRPPATCWPPACPGRSSGSAASAATTCHPRLRRGRHRGAHRRLRRQGRLPDPKSGGPGQPARLP